MNRSLCFSLVIRTVTLMGCLIAMKFNVQASALDWFVTAPYISQLEVTPDGSMIVAATVEGIEFRDPINGEILKAYREIGSPDSLDISRDGRRLAWVESRFLEVWSLIEDRRLFRVPEMSNSEALARQPRAAVQFSSDGNTIVTGTTRNRDWPPSVELWSALTGEHLGTLSQPGSTAEIQGSTILFSDVGDLLIYGSGFRGLDTEISIYSFQENRFLASIETSATYGIGQIALSPDDEILATGPSDYRTGHVEIWSMPHGAPILKLSTQAHHIGFSPDGELFAAISKSMPDEPVLEFWRVRNWTRLKPLEGLGILGARLGSFVFSNDGGHLYLTGSRQIAYKNESGGISQPTEGILFSISTPLVIIELNVTSDSLELSWTGGAGPFRLEARTLQDDRWRELWKGEERNVSLKKQNERARFFRIQSLTP